MSQLHFRHEFAVAAPLATVAIFHRDPASLARLTPPPFVLRLDRPTPATTSDARIGGARVGFTIWLGPLPIRWLAQIEQVSGLGFTDRLVTGPFAKWEHSHQFTARDDRSTWVTDEVAAQLSPNPFWRAVGLGLWLGMPLLFAYRAFATRRALGSGWSAIFPTTSVSDQGAGVRSAARLAGERDQAA